MLNRSSTETQVGMVNTALGALVIAPVLVSKETTFRLAKEAIVAAGENGKFESCNTWKFLSTLSLQLDDLDELFPRHLQYFPDPCHNLNDE